MTTMPWRRLPDRAAVEVWLRDRLAEQARTGHGTYVITDREGTLIGFCGFLPRDEELEVGWVIQQPHWGNGFATEAVAAVLATARDRRIVAVIRPGNLASIRVPTMIIQGRHDRVRTPEHGMEMRDRIPGSVLEVIEDAGHTPQLEQPQRFHDVALPFLLQGRARSSGT